VSKLSLRRDPIRLVLSRGLWAAAWYLLGYLVVGWALFAIALSTAVAGAGLSITFAGLPVLAAAAAGPVASPCPHPGHLPAGHRARHHGPATCPLAGPGDLAGRRLPGRHVRPALDAIVLAVWWGFLAGIAHVSCT